MQAVGTTVRRGAFGVRRGQVQIVINTCVYEDSGKIVLLVTVHISALMAETTGRIAVALLRNGEQQTQRIKQHRATIQPLVDWQIDQMINRELFYPPTMLILILTAPHTPCPPPPRIKLSLLPMFYMMLP